MKLEGIRNSAEEMIDLIVFKDRAQVKDRMAALAIISSYDAICLCSSTCPLVLALPLKISDAANNVRPVAPGSAPCEFSSRPSDALGCNRTSPSVISSQALNKLGELIHLSQTYNILIPRLTSRERERLEWDILYRLGAKNILAVA